ncbi:MAG: hypothetical protein R2839_07540 [Thermomicrobiales bacterium]
MSTRSRTECVDGRRELLRSIFFTFLALAGGLILISGLIDLSAGGLRNRFRSIEGFAGEIDGIRRTSDTISFPRR